MSEEKKTFTPGVILQTLVYVVFFPFLPIIITWDWGWLEAWLYALLAIFGFLISRILAAKKHPDLLTERSKFASKADAKSWDKILARLVGLGGVFLPLVAALDVRDGWSDFQFTWGWKIAALIVMLLGYIFGTWAMMENRFFSAVVRIQTDRGHHVVDSGPYRWVRHPGYVGGLLAAFAIPILLDSLWTFGVVAVYTIALIIRTSLEDRTLQAELPGYAEFTERTRYRLFPGIW
ncbi:MAG: isoprenylcysteine carboxylmethyltransferase family protein [Anaerolineae bacterium]|jgi:protein-S-isoprenylcysteine O-methyltransferase Ste14|nr:isoprenylcysteine carboxylmethyltransferase family protein [Anaerolineae bacterium]MBT7071613.1 isoprenylcysteine carboxylmethyltransferase family protein [Anaerolineae bacterium]MBT7326432.1 isoprenylcysteine carboxylmethyltransferase family protein [Anaerolineae bacterium]MBT7602510.1 isoprenylcysteine carboxylmethyltransferase family protein [Anaerolineae bacterium]